MSSGTPPDLRCESCRKPIDPPDDAQPYQIREYERDHLGRVTPNAKLIRTMYLHRGCKIPPYFTPR